MSSKSNHTKEDIALIKPAITRACCQLIPYCHVLSFPIAALVINMPLTKKNLKLRILRRIKFRLCASPQPHNINTAKLQMQVDRQIVSEMGVMSKEGAGSTFIVFVRVKLRSPAKFSPLFRLHAAAQISLLPHKLMKTSCTELVDQVAPEAARIAN
jgi:hypothetical protein